LLEYRSKVEGDATSASDAASADAPAPATTAHPNSNNQRQKRTKELPSVLQRFADVDITYSPLEPKVALSKIFFVCVFN
jgi:hypothetical protein